MSNSSRLIGSDFCDPAKENTPRNCFGRKDSGGWSKRTFSNTGFFRNEGVRVWTAGRRGSRRYRRINSLQRIISLCDLPLVSLSLKETEVEGRTDSIFTTSFSFGVTLRTSKSTLLWYFSLLFLALSSLLPWQSRLIPIWVKVTIRSIHNKWNELLHSISQKRKNIASSCL